MTRALAQGGVAEWFNAAVLKTVVPVRAPGVRIPPPPPYLPLKLLSYKLLLPRFGPCPSPIPSSGAWLSALGSWCCGLLTAQRAFARS
jgi:hypothetical protein